MANLFDSANIPEIEPTEIRAGDILQWKRTDLHKDYPNDQYTLKYTATVYHANHHDIDITATASGNDYLVSVPSATTEDYNIGEYDWQAYIIRNSDSERITIDSGHWTIIDDYDSSNSDVRIHAQKMLDHIESFLETKATNGDVSSYSIGGRSLSKFSFEEITNLRNYYKREVAQHIKKQRLKGGRYSTGNNVKVVF
jgi:disulfide oxidoreductase YuzD